MISTDFETNPPRGMKIQVAAEAHRGHRVGWIWAVLMAGALLAVPGQFADPFIRSDDFVGLFPQADFYYNKTLSEGRWLNWLWMLRPWPTDPTTVYALYVGLWALASALVGVALAPGRGQASLALLIALAFALMPQHTHISFWFNTMVPGAALLAGFAALVLYAPVRVVDLSLIVMVPLALMAHTAYPFLLLALAAALAGPDAGRGRMLRLLAIFVASVGLGLVAIHAINWAVHGYFGLVVPGWRESNPLTGIDSLIENIGRAARSMSLAFATHSFVLPQAALGFIGLLFLAILSLRRDAPERAALMLLGLLVSLAIPSAHIVLSGIAWPFRSTGFVWAFAVLFVGLAIARSPSPARQVGLTLGLTLAIAGAGLYGKAHFVGQKPAYQAESRRIAERIMALPGIDGAREVLVAGQAHGLRGSGDLQFAVGLRLRLELLTGLAVRLCDSQAGNMKFEASKPEDTAALALLRAVEKPHHDLNALNRARCEAEADALAALRPDPAPWAVAMIRPGVVGLRLPERILSDNPP